MTKILLKKLAVILLITLTTSVFAQNQLLTVGNNSNVKNQPLLTLQNDNQTIIRFELNTIELFEVNTDYGQAFIATSDVAPFMLQEGKPEMFYLTASFIIPDTGSSELEISCGQYQEFENIEIAPSKGNLPRSIDPATVPFVKGEIYQKDGFYPGTLASLREPFIMRDIRGQSLDVFPVQYNPVTKILRVYSEIIVTVNYTENEGINEFINQKRHKTIDPTFNQMYQNLFINYDFLNRGFPTSEEGELLIICHTPFVSEMQPYVDWKRTIGRKTTIVPTSAITPLTAANIKTYIQNYYNNPDNNLAFVLLVGDSPQIPAHQAPNAPSDVVYGQLTSPPYMDILIGRMSAENVAHVQTQVQRSIQYERDMTTIDSWLPTGVGIAANEGSGQGHDSGEADYVHMNNIRTRLLANGYSTVYQEYTSGCGVPATSANQISQRFNSGVSMGNYCNHGSLTAWTLTGGVTYSTSHVNALQNAGKLPYLFSVACNNGEFMSGTCFAEAWLRATQNNQPTGAISAFMATISLSWHPPMTAQDIFVNICLDLPSPYNSQPGIKRTIAGAMLNASQGMIMRHGTNPGYLTARADYDSWTVFGDPTLMFRTKTPQEMTISHLQSIPTGITEFEVNCNTEGALAALTYIGAGEVIILGTATVTGGVANIVFTETPTTDSYTLAVTAFNKITYLTAISAGGALELPPPQNLTYTVEKANYVILNWDEPEASSMTVTGYNVYRDDTLINTEPIRDSRTYTDIVPANGTYKYDVTALYNSTGTLESEPCEPVTVIIDGMCIPFGSNIVVEQVTEEHILVSWEAPQYEGTELAGYNVLRNEETINTGIISGLSFLDVNTERDVEYCYQVEVVYNDCEEPLKSNIACLTVVSINDVSANPTIIQIFPNPTTGKFKITNHETQITNIEIFDMMGRALGANLRICSETNETTFDLSNIPNGIYYIKIETENGTITKKIVKI